MTKTTLIAATFITTMLLAVPAFAQTSVSASLGTKVTVGNKSSVNVDATSSASTQIKISNAIGRADQEIERRINILQNLNTAVQGMIKVSTSEKTAISTEVGNEVTNLTTLKATIDAETSITNLRTDIQSITKDYRIFILVIPQGRIEVAADKIETIVSDYTTLASNLQTRISQAPSGTNTTQVSAWLSDMNTQVGNANTQAQAAVSLVANLQPDQGNATIEASNTAALKTAAGDIKTALGDLKTARQDAGNIVKAVESWNTGASASGSVTATTSVNTQ